MFMKEDVAEPLLMFEEDPETGEFTNKISKILFAMGEVMTPRGAQIICRDADGFEWHVLRSSIKESDDSQYGWARKVYHRMLAGFEEDGRM